MMIFSTFSRPLILQFVPSKPSLVYECSHNFRLYSVLFPFSRSIYLYSFNFFTQIVLVSSLNMPIPF